MTASLDILTFFADFVRKELGIVYPEANYYQLEGRLKDVAKELGLPDVEALYGEFRRGASQKAKNIFLDAATNNETSFFRDAHLFSAIEALLVGPNGIAQKKSSPVRIWSAACSYGQEVYTLAMQLDGVRAKLPGGRVEIIATDISDRALRSAESGIYTSLQINRGLSPAQIAKYFDPVSGEDGKFRVKADLRRSITFKKLNLLDSFSGLGPFDLVLCRNVLIYQSVEGKRGIVNRIADTLLPHGCLVLGAAESLIGVSEEYEQFSIDKATMYRRATRQSKVG